MTDTASREYGQFALLGVLAAVITDFITESYTFAPIRRFAK